MPLPHKVIASAIILALGALAARHSLASADASPPPIPSLGGPAPFQYEDTNVQMVFERVEMTVLPDHTAENATHHIEVSAWFVMRNLGDAPEQMDVAFPLESLNQCEYSDPWERAAYANADILLSSFSASANGAELRVTEATTPFPADLSCESPEMSWATFPVTFPEGQDVVLTVEYSMQFSSADFIQTIEYALQTGSGWRGPISRGYIVFRLPYLVDSRNILSNTTPGYQRLWNEIYWSLEDLEPSPSDDLTISFVAPSTWIDLEAYRERTRINPTDAEAWRLLAEALDRIATYKGVYRVWEYRDSTYAAYENGLAANPENMPLLQSYAEFLMESCCYYSISDLSDLQPVLRIYDRILSIEPQDESTWRQIHFMEGNVPGFQYSPPPTRTPTSTPLASPTIPPSTTPLASQTPSVTFTIMRTPTSAARPPASSPAPTPSPMPSDALPTWPVFLAIAAPIALVFIFLTLVRRRK